MKKFFTSDTFLISYLIVTFCLLDMAITSLYWKHLSVEHNAAHYEVNSWGTTTFKWNDESYAQTPFQDEGWKRVQDALFDQKIKSLGIK